MDLGAVFGPLFPGGGVRRGTFLQVDGGPGATSVGLALVAEPSRNGSWVAVLGGTDLGWAAAAELGVELHHLAVVRADSSWVTALAALIDGFDVVLVDAALRPSAAQARRLRSRARERGVVLMVLAPSGGHQHPRSPDWGGAPDLRLVVTGAQWEGLGDENGWGHLRARRLHLQITGRRGASRGRHVELWLPGPRGGVELVSSPGNVTPLRRAV